ncbi:MAG: MarR family winged helix-turn-helix transcriptional regulator [Pseudomonadales bacterium]
MKDYDEFLISLRQITRAIDLHSRKIQKQSGLTTSQLLVLEAIEKLPVATPKAIAQEIVLSQATVTSLIDRLEKGGLVKREKLDSDKRSVRINLTAEGEGKLSGAPDILQTQFLEKYRTLEPWEQQMLIAALSRIASMMNAEDLDASPILTSGDIKVEWGGGDPAAQPKRT